MKTIILFKATTEETENSFEKVLEQTNLHVITIKTLDFVYKNLDVLKSCLDAPDKYAGIIFTSPRCVTSVHKALNGNLLRDEWKSKKNYGVGPKTVANVLSSLDVKCLGAESGNADNLAEIILQDDHELPLLYPKGNLAKDTLKLKVTNTQDVIVYDTVTSQTIEHDLSAATNNFQQLLDYVVFFSPSGVKGVVPYFSKLSHSHLKAIAIGPTTKASLQEFNIPVSGTCEKPSAEGLLALIKSIESL